ncbi:MAG: hypothetical protein NTX86_04355 [Candidatus Dependentiae bacterium]|nr:hypothetical protein [Candidatus Dependentiae bacterium]
MKSIKISSQHQQALQEVLIKYYPVRDIITQIDQQGGRVFLVGGAVRDVLLDRVIKDLDIEVHGLLLSQLEEILRHYGPVSLVGKSFGVLRLHVLDVDWSLPRTDSKIYTIKFCVRPIRHCLLKIPYDFSVLCSLLVALKWCPMLH